MQAHPLYHGVSLLTPFNLFRVLQMNMLSFLVLYFSSLTSEVLYIGYRVTARHLQATSTTEGISENMFLEKLSFKYQKYVLYYCHIA